MVQTLHGTYSSTVTLGSSMFGVQVAVTGTINLGLNTGDGIYAAASVANAYVLNDGTIYGGIIGSPGETGCGIYLSSIGTVSNDKAGAIIRGGEGTSPDINAPPGTSGYSGGIGVDLNSGGMLTNMGLVEGGTGGFSLADGGGEGDGFDNTYGPATVMNYLTIYGGRGGQGNTGGGSGGIGVSLDGGGKLVNGTAAHPLQGLVSGGDGGAGGGAYGGIGVLLDQFATANNYGQVYGGGATSANHYYQNGDAGGIGLLGRKHGDQCRLNLRRPGIQCHDHQG